MTGGQPRIGIPEGLDTDWMAKAMCDPEDNDIFFPLPGESAERAYTICRACPVPDECDYYADEIGAKHGVWGGRRREGPEEREARLKEEARARYERKFAKTFARIAAQQAKRQASENDESEAV